MANHLRDGAKEAYWRELLLRHAASGLSVRAFCRQEQLAESAFHAWRRTIAQRDHPTAPARTERIEAAECGGASELASAAAAFVPVVVTELPAREAPIELELAGGRVLRVPASYSHERLAQLIVLLERGGPR